MAKVLLIDDEEIVRKVVRLVLEADGHEVSDAADGAAGLEVLRTLEPDVVVLDMMMPGMSGADVCRQIKSSGDEVKVIVLTSLPTADAEEQAASCGADDFMQKPFSSLELLQRLRDLTRTQ